MIGRAIYHRRGFTFVELMMGIMVTGLVLSALAVFVYGVADGWTSSESAQSTFLAGNMGVDRIDRYLREASSIGPATAGSPNNSTTPASCMIWHDDNGDGLITFSELSLLQYSPGLQAIVRYDVNPQNALAGTSVLVIPTATVFQATGALQTPTPMAHEITACEFFAVPAPASGRPSLEIVMNVGDGDAKTTIYTTATLRCPHGSQ